jgi:polyhydroxyalkanoate synthesis regulator phasin
MDFKKEIVKLAEKIMANYSEKEVEYQKARTLDGAMVAWKDEILKAGAAFYIMSEEGVKPAETGEYELENGDIVVVEAGAVSDYLVKQNEEMNKFNAEEFKAEILEAMTERIAAIDAKFAEYEVKFESVKAELSAKNSESAESVIKAVNELKTELSKMSEEVPERRPATEFSEQGKYASLFKSLKENHNTK